MGVEEEEEEEAADAWQEVGKRKKSGDGATHGEHVGDGPGGAPDTSPAPQGEDPHASGAGAVVQGKKRGAIMRWLSHVDMPSPLSRWRARVEDGLGGVAEGYRRGAA